MATQLKMTYEGMIAETVGFSSDEGDNGKTIRRLR